jgi:hypothetical protein
MTTDETGEQLYVDDPIIDVATGKHVHVISLDEARGKVLMSTGVTTRCNRVRYNPLGRQRPS